jgi:heme o synthase
MKQTVRAYYYLTKPGIIYSNAIAACAGFLLASKWHVNPILLLETLGGVMFIIAAACVFNNYMDQGIDKRMKRTEKRALVSGKISGKAALIYGAVLLFIGFGLISQTNLLTTILGLVALVMYVAVYGYFKRKSVYGTLVGSVSGALPPVAGYTAVTGHIDAAAVILFLILTAWQMPHFYAIAMFRYKDYKAAKIPVLPVVRGMKAAKRQIFAYIVLLAVVAPFLTILGYTGIVYLCIVVLTAGFWVVRAVRLYHLEDVAWARKMFFTSLFALFALCFAIATGSVLV